MQQTKLVYLILLTKQVYNRGLLASSLNIWAGAR